LILSQSSCLSIKVSHFPNLHIFVGASQEDFSKFDIVISCLQIPFLSSWPNFSTFYLIKIFLTFAVKSKTSYASCSRLFQWRENWSILANLKIASHTSKDSFGNSSLYLCQSNFLPPSLWNQSLDKNKQGINILLWLPRPLISYNTHILHIS